MSEFSIKQAAFAGYGLIRRKPALFVALAVFGVLINLVTMYLTFAAAGPMMAQVMEMTRAGDRSGMQDPTFGRAMGGAMTQMYALLAVSGLLVYVVNAGAVSRAIIRPAKSRSPYIGFGGGEFRQLAVAFVVGPILGIAFIMVSIVAFIAAFASSAATGELARMAESGGMTTPPIMAAVMYGGMGLGGILVFLLGVRFSLAPALTEREEAVRIFGSWGLCKGRYWRMTGAYALGALSVLPVYLAVLGVNVGLAMSRGLTGSEAFMAASQPDWSQSVFSPSVLVFIVTNALIGTLGWVVSLGSSCTIFADVAGTAVDADDDDDDDDDDED